MRKRTEGERILLKYGPCWIEGKNHIALRNDINRAIRREKAKAWDECEKLHDIDDCNLNPYRGRAKTNG